MKTTNEDDTIISPSPWDTKHTGLTKRELFSAMAMMNLQNVILRKNQRLEIEKMIADDGAEIDLEQYIASAAVQQADALIEALNVCVHSTVVKEKYDGAVGYCNRCGVSVEE